MTSPFCDTIKLRNVFLYPTEYLTYGVGKQSSLITKPDGSKEYRFFDHLGSSRGVLGDSGFTFTDYAPFGELLGGGTESRKGFIDKEKDGESELRNHGVRAYEDNLGRFLSIDPLWESFPTASPYIYSINSPLILRDATGDSAWKISNQWNDEFINKFRTYAANQSSYYHDKGTKFTCEDLALTLLIEFASNNQLPLSITNESGVYNAASDDYSNTGDFMIDVMSTTGARDLQRTENTTTLNVFNVGDLLVNRNSDNVANHIQVVSSITSSTVNIFQGNLERNLFPPKFSNVPGRWIYLGMSVQAGFIDRSTNTYTNLSTGNTLNNYWSNRNVEARGWNFYGWNK